MRLLVCNKSDVPENGMKCFTLEGEHILVVRVDGRFLAVSDSCSHAGSSLSEGTLDGYTVQCPHHGGTFDVRTGEALTYPAVAPVERFELIVEGEEIFLEIDF